MSTTPTEILESTIAATEAIIAETTAATEGALDLHSIKDMMDGFDPASLLPNLSELFESLAPVCRFAVMIGPLVLLVLGISYLFFVPKEANYYFGYRCYFGMGSEYAWRFTQRLAGLLFGGMGLVLTVIMFLVCGGFGETDVMGIVDVATTCILWEIGLMLLCCVAIDILLIVRYDRKGVRRKENRRLRREKRAQKKLEKMNKNNGIA